MFFERFILHIQILLSGWVEVGGRASHSVSSHHGMQRRAPVGLRSGGADGDFKLPGSYLMSSPRGRTARAQTKEDTLSERRAGFDITSLSFPLSDTGSEVNNS